MKEINHKEKSIFNKFIGDRAFYKMVLGVAVPIMIQNGITNFVSLLDNIMIGRVGTEQMSGASIVNQLLFVYYLCIFGGVSGAGIFTAQYFGQKDSEGVRRTFRYKLWLALLLTAATIILLSVRGEELITLYLQGDGSTAAALATLSYGKKYLAIMLFGLPAFMAGQIYSSTLRECGETVVPMKSGVIAVFVNLALNYILIYGKLGFPAMGVQGAAIATVISRYAEMLIIVCWTHTHKDKQPFAEGLYRTLFVPLFLTKRIFIKGMPLLVNETLWGFAVAMLSQCYSVRGLNVVAGMNISSTISNVFSIAFIALGDSVAIVVGQLLGAGEMEKARDTDNKLIAFSVLCSIGVAAVMLFAAPFFPRLYQTNDEARELARNFIIIMAICMPIQAFLHAAYFTLRSGGRTIITFFFDSVFIWTVSVSIAYSLSRFTTLPVTGIFAIVQAADFLKCIVGFVLVKKGVWLQNIVS